MEGVLKLQTNALKRYQERRNLSANKNFSGKKKGGEFALKDVHMLFW